MLTDISQKTLFPDLSQSVPLDVKQVLVKTLQRETLTALTMTDPWGSAISGKAKRIETRSWAAPQRYWGQPLAIHVASTLPQEARAICDVSPFCEVLQRVGYSKDARGRWQLPLRQVIALVWLEQVEPITSHYQVDPYERLFGNYAPGRFAWKLGAVYQLKQPIEARGSLGLWRWTPPESFWDEIQRELDLLQADSSPHETISSTKKG